MDLKPDILLIEEYEYWHQEENIWPEISNSLIAAGIEKCEIYRTGNRLFMILEVTEDFDFSRKDEMDAANPKVQEWETLMWNFQQPLPWAEKDEKWVSMDKIFEL